MKSVVVENDCPYCRGKRAGVWAGGRADAAGRRAGRQPAQAAAAARPALHPFAKPLRRPLVPAGCSSMARQGVETGRPFLESPLPAASPVAASPSAPPCVGMAATAAARRTRASVSRHSASHASPSPPVKRSSAAGPSEAARPGSASMAAADPRYMPLVVRLTARARSVGGIHAASTVCTAGMRKPW